MLELLFATTVLTDWPDFSSQAVAAYGYSPVIRSAPPDTRMLHVSGVTGVTSQAGIPSDPFRSCNEALHGALPQARVLAADRAETLASELGVTLGPSLNRTETPDFLIDPQTKYDCGYPKIGRPPLTVVDSETFAIARGDFVIAPAGVAPEPVPSPSFLPQVLPPPMSPQTYDVDIMIRETGYVERLAQHETLTLLVQPLTPDPNDPRANGPQTNADLAPIVTALKSVRPDSNPVTRFDSFAIGTRESHYQQFRGDIVVDIDDPRAADADAFRRAVEAAALPLNFRVEPVTSAHEPHCAQLEDDARRDAIVRARYDLAAQGYAGKPLRLVFADEQPTNFAEGNCGPTLENDLPFSGTWSFAQPNVAAYVTLTLEFQRTPTASERS